jgi:hypothetical protein
LLLAIGDGELPLPFVELNSKEDELLHVGSEADHGSAKEMELTCTASKKGGSDGDSSRGGDDDEDGRRRELWESERIVLEVEGDISVEIMLRWKEGGEEEEE